MYLLLCNNIYLCITGNHSSTSRLITKFVGNFVSCNLYKYLLWFYLYEIILFCNKGNMRACLLIIIASISSRISN